MIDPLSFPTQTYHVFNNCFRPPREFVNAIDNQVYEQYATPNKKNCFRSKLYSLSIWIFVIAKCLNVHELKNKVLYSVI